MGVIQENVFLDASIFGAYNWFHESRNIYIISNLNNIFQRTATNSHNGGEYIAHLGAETSWGKVIEFSPLATVDYVYLHEQGYHEHGADGLDLKVKSKNSDLLRSEIGFRLLRCYSLFNGQFVPNFKLGWVHEARFKGKTTKASFQDSCCVFSVKGLNPNRNLVAPSLGLIYLSDNIPFSIAARYDGQFGSQYYDQLVSLDLSFKY